MGGLREARAVKIAFRSSMCPFLFSPAGFNFQLTAVMHEAKGGEWEVVARVGLDGLGDAEHGPYHEGGAVHIHQDRRGPERDRVPDQLLEDVGVLSRERLGVGRRAS